MDNQTIGALLPAWLLIIPLIVGVLDFFAIGKITTSARY